MLKYFLVIALLALPLSAKADHFEEVVKARCDPAQSVFIISHEGAYNEKGLQLVAHLKSDQWDVRRLFERSGKPLTVMTHCRLRDIGYKLEISGLSWDKFFTSVTANVKIKRDGQMLFDGNLDSNPLQDDSIPKSITKIMIKPENDKVRIMSIPTDEFHIRGAAKNRILLGTQK